MSNDPDIGGHLLKANVNEVWEAENNLPTGRQNPSTGRSTSDTPPDRRNTALDHVFTGCPDRSGAARGVGRNRGTLAPGSRADCACWPTPTFRELVLFTPPHRQAVAIEPYTCSADAANSLPAASIAAGGVLEPGSDWEVGRGIPLGTVGM